MIGWQIERQRGSAREFHALDPTLVDHRSAWVLEVEAPALALGSSQPESDVDAGVARQMGVDTFRRRSGGGAVFLAPQSCVWIDIILPVRDPLWRDDVSLAPLWLGEVWAATLQEIGVLEPRMHQGPMVRPALAPVVCFAGLAPGEVTAQLGTGDGTRGKSVGISQRRTRSVARFQTIALLDWDLELHRQLLAPGIGHVDGAGDAASIRVRPAAGVGAGALTEAFLDQLDRLG